MANLPMRMYSITQPAGTRYKRETEPFECHCMLDVPQKSPQACDASIMGPQAADIVQVLVEVTIKAAPTGWSKKNLTNKIKFKFLIFCWRQGDQIHMKILKQLPKIIKLH